jgi:hypothetical protein
LNKVTVPPDTENAPDSGNGFAELEAVIPLGQSDESRITQPFDDRRPLRGDSLEHVFVPGDDKRLFEEQGIIGALAQGLGVAFEFGRDLDTEPGSRRKAVARCGWQLSCQPQSAVQCSCDCCGGWPQSFALTS